MLNIELGVDSADGIYSYLGNLTIDNCAVIINGGWSGVFMKYGMEGEDGVFTIKGENALLNSTGQQAAMMNIGTLVLDKNLAIVVPEGEGVSKHPKTHKALTFPSQGFAMSKSFCTFRQKFQTMTKVHIRPYITNQLILFPQRIDEDIAEK